MITALIVVSLCLLSVSLVLFLLLGEISLRKSRLEDRLARVCNTYAAFAVLQAQVGLWSRRNFPKNKPYFPLLGAFEECGELAHAHLKQEQGIRGTIAEHEAAKKDAVADIVIYLADYCERHDIDMASAVEETWDQVRTRDWIKFPKNGRTE